MTTDLHHDIGREFPELKDKIHLLKTENAHFARLFDDYHQIDKEVARIEAQGQPVSDAYAEECKKKRVLLKDEIFEMLRGG